MPRSRARPTRSRAGGVKPHLAGNPSLRISIGRPGERMSNCVEWRGFVGAKMESRPDGKRRWRCDSGACCGGLPGAAQHEARSERSLRAALPCLIEIPQIGGRLVLPAWHQAPVSAEEIGFGRDIDVLAVGVLARMLEPLGVAPAVEA